MKTNFAIFFVDHSYQILFIFWSKWKVQSVRVTELTSFNIFPGVLPISYRYKKYTTTIPLLAKRYGMSFLTSPLPKQSENLFVPGNYLLENVFPQQNRRKIYEIRYCNTGQKIFSTEKYNRVRVVKNCMQSSGTNPVWCSYELYAIHMISHYFLNWRRKVTLHILIQLWELVFQRIKKDCRCLFDPEENPKMGPRQ